MRNQDLESHRHQFRVLAVDRDEAQAQALADEVKSFGYPETTAAEAAGSIAQIIHEPPHIVLCDFNAPSELEIYLSALQDAAPNSLIILLTSADQNLASLKLIEKGLAYDSVIRPLVAPLELSQKIDRAAGELYHALEAVELRGLLSAPANSSLEISLNDFLQQIASSRTIDETTQVFIDALSSEWQNAPVYYFKYLPLHASLALAQASRSTSIDAFRGLGLDLKNEAPVRLDEVFLKPMESERLQKFVKDVFGTTEFLAFAHQSPASGDSGEGETYGIFVALTKEREDFTSQRSRPLALKRVFDLAFKKNVTLKEKHALDSTDAVTGVLSRRFFSEKVEQEISRSRRILMPLSLITIDCDGFGKINERIGTRQADAVLKAIATILRRTTRVSDVIARTGADEFSLLLPHTSHHGAAIKAERLRRLIESTKFPSMGPQSGAVTVSCGVSEYPSLSSDPETLVRSADEALAQVRTPGNKVCLATVDEDFELDFVPREFEGLESVSERRR